jgi:hypothetical protein
MPILKAPCAYHFHVMINWLFFREETAQLTNFRITVYSAAGHLSALLRL